MFTEQQLNDRIKIQKRVISELKELRDNPVPVPQPDWDLVWVLSGPEVTLDEKGAFGGVNETRSRLITGFNIIRKITAQRVSLPDTDISLQQVTDFGPSLYFNGIEQQNCLMRQLQAMGTFERQYLFPDEKILVAPEGTDIRHTGDQFEKFPEELLSDKRYIIIVSSARHLPRVRRYLGLESNPFHNIQNQVIFYPALPLNFPFKGTRDEIKKIPNYQTVGILPPEN